MMKREKLLAYIVDEIVRRKDESKPFKVAIDGRGGSGKSVLAGELATALRSRDKSLEILRPSVDGFHHPQEHRYRQGEYSAVGYYEDAYDYEAVIDCLLAPLSGGAFPVWCRQVSRDLRTDLPDDSPPISVNARSVLLFEGLFLFRREINDYWDFRILLDVGPETALSRAVSRDTGLIGPSDIMKRKYEVRYEPAWQIYLDQEHPDSKADLIVDNRDFLNSRLLKYAIPSRRT